MAYNFIYGVYFVFIATNCVRGSCPDVQREVWGARPPVLRETCNLPVPYVIIHHTYIPSACSNATSCQAAMRAMQDMHQISRGWNDIGYNFCVGGDGLVYEGRGWDRVGAHAPRYNDKSIGICFIGDYRTELPSPAMLAAAKQLIECAIARGTLSPDYKLHGHRQVRNTECPGGALFNEIQNWPHFSATPTTTTIGSTSTTEAITTTEATTTTESTTTIEPTIENTDDLTVVLTEAANVIEDRR